MNNNNTTQHYVSQGEQRLNSLNPAANHSNQHIYSFTVTERESFTLSLDSPRGRSISKSLALRDLFSFDVIRDSTSRFNFEAFFQQYEADMESNTIALLRKIEQGSSEGLKKEILEIFVAKFMNFLRNPYSVRKVLNTIGHILRLHPTDPELLAQYNAVLAGRKPHQSHLCAQLDISPAAPSRHRHSSNRKRVRCFLRSVCLAR